MHFCYVGAIKCIYKHTKTFHKLKIEQIDAIEILRSFFFSFFICWGFFFNFYVFGLSSLFRIVDLFLFFNEISLHPLVVMWF